MGELVNGLAAQELAAQEVFSELGLVLQWDWPA